MCRTHAFFRKHFRCGHGLVRQSEKCFTGLEEGIRIPARAHKINFLFHLFPFITHPDNKPLKLVTVKTRKSMLPLPGLQLLQDAFYLPNQCIVGQMIQLLFYQTLCGSAHHTGIIYDLGISLQVMNEEEGDQA